MTKQANSQFSIMNILSRSLLPLLIMGACYSSSAIATSCAGVSSTLQEDYDQAESIILAQVSGCADQSLPQNNSCPNQLYSFTTLEVLKDSVPSRDHDNDLQGADMSGCGMYFGVGRNYLLFFDENGNLNHNASGYLNGADVRVYSTNDRLDIIRQYRDGLIPDLSEPWKFMDTGLNCTISHRFKGGAMTLSFYYASKDYGPMTMDISYGPDGEIQYDPKPYPPGREPPKVEIIGPEFERDSVMIDVSLENPEQFVEGSTSIKIGQQSWPLQRTTVVVDAFGIDKHTVHSDVIGGESALEILDAMNGSRDIAISGVPIGIGATPVTETPVRYETKTTQLPNAAKKFSACADGTARRSHPQYP